MIMQTIKGIALAMWYHGPIYPIWCFIDWLLERDKRFEPVSDEGWEVLNSETREQIDQRVKNEQAKLI